MGIKSLKIMIVDDEQDDAVLTTRYLKKGFPNVNLTINHATTLAELENTPKLSRYDLFLIDYHLGKHTGLEVMKRLKKLEVSSPVILLTGLGDERVAVNAMKEGARDYLKKETLSSEILCNSIRYSINLFRAEKRREKAERKLTRNEDKYRTIIDTTTEGYWLFDLNLRTIDLNAALCNMLGYTREEMLKIKPDAIVQKEKQMSFQKALDSTLSTSQKVFESTLITKSGKTLHTIINATVLRNRSGIPRQIFTLITDINKQKAMETALKKANEALKKVDMMKSDFVANVSHELRTPLTSIKNAIGILIKGKTGPFNEKQEHFLKMAVRNIDRLASLTNEVLDLSKLEARKINIQPVAFQISPLIEGITHLFQVQAKEKEIRLNADFTQVLPTIYADPNRVEQVLCNLLSNALKFTPKNGQVVLSLNVTSKWVTIDIADTGPGLLPEDQIRVFERFYQVGDSLGQPIQGTGLGLSIAKELVEMQGGTLEVESQLGKGSRFYFKLPVYSDEAIEMAKLEETIRSLQKSSIFSLIVISIQSGKINTTKIQDKNILRQVTDSVRRILRLDSDLVLTQLSLGQIICLLPETSKADAAVVKNRLQRFLNLYHCFDKEDDTLLPVFTEPVSYPEDGETGRELIFGRSEPHSQPLLK